VPSANPWLTHGQPTLKPELPFRRRHVAEKFAGTKLEGGAAAVKILGLQEVVWVNSGGKNCLLSSFPPPIKALEGRLQRESRNFSRLLDARSPIKAFEDRFRGHDVNQSFLNA
jgi:hypothetical protein